MRNILKANSIIVLTVGMAGCVSTSEMEVAPNVVILQSEARGALFAGRSGPEMMKRGC
jgi:monoamine oxidase